MKALFRFVVACILLVAIAGGAAAWWAWERVQPVSLVAAPQVPFQVERGWGARTVAQSLEDAGLVHDAWVFEALLRYRGDDRRIGEGWYDLAPSMDAWTVADVLIAGGRPETVRLTVPEGWRLTQVAERIAETLPTASPADVASISTVPDVDRPSWLPDGATLEGVLLPDTYELRIDASFGDAVATMLAAFQSLVDSDAGRRASEVGLDPYAWATLASMVQVEAGSTDEMPIIAGVFLNRLDLGMPLQSDPTVAFGLGKTLPELSRPDGDFQADHPWNTYLYAGLPAGPIGLPGRAALLAVLDPTRTREDGVPWLYFMHGVDASGAPVFRPNVDLDAHVRDVNRYLR